METQIKRLINDMEFSDVKEILPVINTRAKRLKDPAGIAQVLGSGFVLAGGALSSDEEPKDFDVYVIGGAPSLDTLKERVKRKYGWSAVLEKTGNALTAKISDQIVQFCSYSKPSMMELIKAFDFSHCQAGVEFNVDGSIARVLCTVPFERFYWTGETEYTGSEYPLSSLMRCMKFIHRGIIESQEAWKPIVLDILVNIVSRGFIDEEDFKDQCDSISESFGDMNSDVNDLFTLLKKGYEGVDLP